MHAYSYGIPIRVWDIILSHTCTGYPIRIRDIPYAYGMSHTRMGQYIVCIWGRTVSRYKELQVLCSCVVTVATTDFCKTLGAVVSLVLALMADGFASRVLVSPVTAFPTTCALLRGNRSCWSSFWFLGSYWLTWLFCLL